MKWWELLFKFHGRKPKTQKQAVDRVYLVSVKALCDVCGFDCPQILKLSGGVDVLRCTACLAEHRITEEDEFILKR